MAHASGPGQYGPPEWLPLRHDAGGGGINVGCTYGSPDGLCDGHHGYWAIDFLGSTGSPVYAAGAGFATDVTGAGYEGYGNAVVVDHGPHGKSLYAHLDEVLIGVGGRWVDENERIGTIGSTGGANTPHLHYEETSGTKFGSAGARDPGPMKACRGTQMVTFPDAWGYSTWRGMPWGSGSVDSEGTLCGVLAGVTGAIGASVAGGAPAVKPVSQPAPERLLAADFDGDGNGDLGFRNSATGLFTMRFGPAFTRQATYPWAPGANYQALAGDFDGDRVADIGLREAGSGMFYIKHGPTYSDQVTYQWTPGAQLQAVTGDFNADRIGDIALRDPATGVVTLKNGPTFERQTTYQGERGSELQLLTADVNSDRMDDLCLRNAPSGLITANLGPTYAGKLNVPWMPGVASEVVAADFNHDGAVDFGLKESAAPVLHIRQGPTFASDTTVPLDPRLEGVAALLGDLFATLAARAF